MTNEKNALFTAIKESKVGLATVIEREHSYCLVNFQIDCESEKEAKTIFKKIKNEDFLDMLKALNKKDYIKNANLTCSMLNCEKENNKLTTKIEFEITTVIEREHFITDIISNIRKYLNKSTVRYDFVSRIDGNFVATNDEGIFLFEPFRIKS